MPQSNSRYNVCEGKCNNRQSIVQCSNCLGWQHIRCTQLSKSQLSLYQKSNELYICQIRINDIIPFQLLGDAEFKEIFNSIIILKVLRVISQTLLVKNLT